uniref:Uncharacterized protein n=1 Tax=Ditylenchus dipsaci TaxID=166011 RepID=A0A915DNS2_9BILA
MHRIVCMNSNVFRVEADTFEVFSDNDREISEEEALQRQVVRLVFRQGDASGLRCCQKISHHSFNALLCSLIHFRHLVGINGQLLSVYFKIL